MKKCPTCQKTYEDNLRFCQTDGTPLVDDAPAPDPYATMVASKDEIMSGIPPHNKPGVSASSSDDDDLLDIPADDDDDNDSMKTMFVTDAERKDLFDEPSSKPIPPPFGQSSSDFQEETKRSEGDTLMAQPEPPKFSEPSLNPPSFGDLSSQSSGSKSDAPSSPFGNEPPSFDRQPLPSDFDAPKTSNDNPFNSPVSSPFGEQEQQQQPMPPSYNASSSPFEPPAFKIEEAKAEQLNTPFADEVSRGNQAVAESSWTPPAAPEQSWQNQEIGQNTPFQPPPAGAGGENKTLAIVSLVLGILSLLCCAWIVPGIAAIITGFIAKKNADQNPNQYGGKGLALGGMITGGISVLLGIIVLFLYLFTGVLAGLGNM